MPTDEGIMNLPQPREQSRDYYDRKSVLTIGELEELRCSSEYAEPVLFRIDELEKRLRETAHAINETMKKPDAMRRSAFMAIVVDIYATLDRKFVLR